jgi:iron complex outermembrane receptor protein
MKKNKLTHSITLLLTGCGLMFNASAQNPSTEDENKEVDEQSTIKVVGSRIRTTDLEGVSPVVTISREELEMSGHNTIQDYVRTLTISSANIGDDNNNSFANGTSSINFRGLGLNATLVLINGRRVAGYGQAQNITQSFVDLNSIPMAAIERIELLKDGASALYGADAVAGVMNIVLRSDYEGAEYSIGYQTDVEGDSPQKSFNAIFGGGNNKTHFTTTFNYLDREALFYRDRDFSATADQRARGGADQRSLFGSPPTLISFENFTVEAADNCTSVINALGGTACSFNYNDFINFYPDSERFATSLFLTHDVNENVQLYVDAAYNNNRSVNIAAPAPWTSVYNVAGSSTVSILSPEQQATRNLLPFSNLLIYFPAENPFNTSGEDLGLLYRPVDFGPRTGEINSQGYRFNAGAKGYLFDTSWDYDIGVGYTRSNVLVENRNGINGVALQQLFLGLQDPSGSGEMLYYNPFEPNEQRILDIARVTYENRNVSWEKSFAANFSGPLFELPAGDLSLAVGAEFREQYFANESDPLRNSGGLVGTGRANDTFGERDITSLYAELLIPLHETLDLQIAARYEDYSDFGTTTKPKVGIKWQPLPELALRASFGESFRAPSLPELFGGVVSSFPTLVDPVRCPDPTGGVAGQNGNAADLTPADCGNGQTRVDNSGNPLLNPEESESYNVGVVWEPTFLDNFVVSFDYFNFDHENIIVQLPLNTILTLNDPNQVIRPGGPGTPISRVVRSFNNGAFQTVSGFDLTMAYNFEWGPGKLGLKNTSTYYDQFDFAPLVLDANNNPTIGAPIDGTGNVVLGDFPQLRNNFTASYAWGGHNISATANYRSGLRTSQANVLTGSADTPSLTTFDLAYTLLIGNDKKLQLGCINCTDKDPVFDPNTSEEAGYFKSTDDPRGAVVYARFTHTF